MIRQGITPLTYALRRAAGSWTSVVNRDLKLTAITDERLHYKAAEEKMQYFSRLAVTAFGLLARVELLLERGTLTTKYHDEVKEKPKNPLASAVDPDARHSAKSDKQHYMGHKTQNLITAESQFIVNIVDEAKDNTDLSPQKVLADGQYSTVANFQGAKGTRP